MPKKAIKPYLWTAADKSRAVAAYAATGSFSKAAELIRIPENTLRYWSKQAWFSEELHRVDKADTDELKSVFTRIAKKAASELEDRLESGDEILDKEGKVIRKKIGGKDLAIISAVAADKRKQQMDVPVTVANQTATEKLASLMAEFVRFAKAKEISYAKDSGETGITIDSEGHGEEPSLRSSDQSAPKSGGFEEGVQQTNP